MERLLAGLRHARQLIVPQDRVCETFNTVLLRRPLEPGQAAEASVVDAERVSSLDARLTYLTLHLVERRASLTDSNAVLAEQLADLARRRLDAGEINVLEYNTAVLESARARSLADRSEGERRAVAAHLGRVVGLSGDSTMITSPLPPLPAPPRDPNGSQAVALQRRPDMQAASLEVEAAGKTLTVSRLRVVPNLELSLFNGKEEGTDDLLGLLLGFSIPLFHRANPMSERQEPIKSPPKRCRMPPIA